MRLLDPYRMDASDLDRDLVDEGTSDEAFDRVEFTLATIDLLRPQRVTIAVVEGPRLRVESGRAWGKRPGSRWAMIAVPKNASRRAIVMAVAGLGSVAPDAYALDVLLRERKP